MHPRQLTARDAQVYELYELAEGEIKIVESKCVQPARIHLSFWHSLNRPYFCFWQSPHSIHYGINYRQLPAIEKGYLLNIRLIYWSWE